MQPVHTLVPAKPYPLSEDGTTEELSTILGALPTPAKPTKTPVLSEVPDMGKYKGNTAKFKAAASQRGLPIARSALQGGQYFDTHQVETPPTVNYETMRESQLASQISTVALHHMHTSQSLKKPSPEVQVGVGETPTDDVDLYASANNKESQQALVSSFSSPFEMIKLAMSDKDRDLRRIGTKLATFKEQQDHRKAQPGADLDSLGVADKMYAKFMDGDLTIPTAAKDRHTEQLVGDKMHECGKYSRAEIAGSKIRCGACVSELGVNTRLPGGTGLSGKVYTSQTSMPRLESMMDRVASGDIGIEVGGSSRSRSSSPARAPLRLREEREKEKQQKTGST
jgi:hypothetical protein